MFATYELRRYERNEKVWTGRYLNLQNMPHWHYDCELIYVETGTVHIAVNEETYTLFAGQSAFIGSGELHYIRSEQGCILIMFLFDSNLIKEIPEQLKSPLLKCSYPLAEQYRTIRQELRERAPYYNLKINSLLSSLLVEIFRKEEKCKRASSKELSALKFKELLAAIEENYASFTFRDATDFTGFCPSYFSRSFHRITGMTFPQYLNHIRVEKAIELLANDDSITVTETAIRCGFGTIRNFNRTFKSITGYTPSAFPQDFVYRSKTLYRVKDNYDPTLEVSKLLDECETTAE